MKRRKAVRLGAVCACTLAILCGSAFAYYTTNGGGSAQASVTSLAAPTVNKAEAATGGTVKLEWSSVSPPTGATGTVTYYVVRGTGQPGGSCPNVTAPKAVNECIDSGLSPGTYEYKVVAVWSGWTKASAVKTATVTVGPAAKFTITSSNATPTAGGAVNLTITAKDSAGGTVTTYTGSHSLTFSGASASPGGNVPTVENSAGTPIAFGTATAINFVAGVATVTEGKNGEMVLYKPGETSVTATDGTLTTPVALAENVAAASAKYFQLASSSNAPTAGSPVNLTIKAVDAYGNVIASYAGSHSLTFSGASASPGGNVPTVENSAGTTTAFGTATAINFVAGVATVTEGKNGEMILYKSGETSVTATDGTLTTSAALAENVVAASAKSLQLSASSTTPATGVAVNLTVKAADAYGNVATTYTGSHALTFSGASASPSGAAPSVKNSSGEAISFGASTTLTFNAGSAAVAESKNGVMTLYKSGETSIAATDGTLTTPVPLVETVTSTAARFVLGVASTTPTAGVADGLTIKAYDLYENLSTGYTGTKSLVFSGPLAGPSGTLPTVENSSGAQIAIGSATTITFKEGQAAASESTMGGELIAYKSGATTLSVKEGSTVTTGTALSLTVGSGTAASLTLTASSTSFATTASSNLTTTAKDTWGNVATGYGTSQNLVYTATGTASEPGPAGTTTSGVSNKESTAQTAFGAVTPTTFSGGVASVASGKNGVLRLYKVGTASISVSDGTLTSAAVTFTVTVGAAKRVTITGLTASAGTVSNPCFISCTVTGLTASGMITSKATIADEYGNPVSNIGANKTVTVTVAGTANSTVTGTPMALPESGVATTTTSFTFKPPSGAGASTNTITLASTGFTSATITASK